MSCHIHSSFSPLIVSFYRLAAMDMLAPFSVAQISPAWKAR